MIFLKRSHYRNKKNKKNHKKHSKTSKTAKIISKPTLIYSIICNNSHSFPRTTKKAGKRIASRPSFCSRKKKKTPFTHIMHNLANPSKHFGYAKGLLKLCLDYSNPMVNNTHHRHRSEVYSIHIGPSHNVPPHFYYNHRSYSCAAYYTFG